MTVGGAVLAGGRSSRMGRSKAWLDWHGTPLVAHVAATLAAALGPGPVIVVRAPGQELPPLPAGVDVAEDAAEGRGPLQGVAAALGALRGRADAAIIVATDQPFAGAALADRLTGALRATDDAVAIQLDGRLQPLGALYRTELEPVAARRLVSGDASLRGLLEAVHTRMLDGTAADGHALQSLDTPAAYFAALRRA